MILAWVAVFRYPRPYFTVGVVVLVVGGCGRGAARAPHLESSHEWFPDQKVSKPWKNVWDASTTTVEPSRGIALWFGSC